MSQWTQKHIHGVIAVVRLSLLLYFSRQAFSNFMEMHPILSTYRVGSITLRIVELEVQRAQHRRVNIYIYILKYAS